jgi:glycosyltransferase involved in cell wall biosynthesis
MKIVHISIYPPQGQKHSNAGGVASYTKNLVTSIPYGTQDSAYLLCDRLQGSEKYTEDGIQIIRCFNKNPWYVFQILRKIRNIKPDVIHIQQELHLYGNILTAFLLQWLLLFISAQKVIITLHGVASLKAVSKKFVQENNSSLPPWMVKMGFLIVYKPLCMWAKKIIVHEKLFQQILSDEYGIRENKNHVIHHGVENLKTGNREEARKTLDIGNKKNTCLFMGYLTGYKGLDLLIEGFSKYAFQDPNALLLIGAGKHPKLKNDRAYLSEYARLQQKAQKLIPSQQYRWVGFIPEESIALYYSASNVLLLPYTTAMAASGPLSFAIGFEQPFLVSDAFAPVFPNSRIVFRQDSVALAEKLKEFFRGHNLSQEVKILKQERLWPIVAQQTYQIYQQ